MSLIEQQVEAAQAQESKPHVWVMVGVLPVSSEDAGRIADDGISPAVLMAADSTLVQEWQGPMCFACEQPFGPVAVATFCPGG